MPAGLAGVARWSGSFMASARSSRSLDRVTHQLVIAAARQTFEVVDATAPSQVLAS
jgi:hypothetical protein